MHKLKDIKREIQGQHEQLEFNRYKMNLLRAELAQTVRQALHSRAALATTFAAGLLLGWRAWVRPPQHGGSPLGGRLKFLGQWLALAKSVFWSSLIRTASGYTSDRIAEGLHEYRDQ
ncbi:MAG TPA: hypothetical protein VFX02_12475 [Gammaproteobacteria bacterium]|nr:hypothetical protein [Gammaproteobacteria bacterium]